MKILIVHNKYRSTYIGGEDIVFDRELKALKKELGEDKVFNYSISNDNIKIINTLFTIWFSKKHYKKVYNLVKENDIDLVHVHNFYPILTLSIFKAAKKAGAKTVHTLHNYRFWCMAGIFYRKKAGICELCKNKSFGFPGIFYRCYRNSFAQSFITACAFFYYKLSKQMKHIDYFFVLTNFQKNKILELGIDQNKIILKPNINRTLEITEGIKKDFIYVGKMDESKGVLELLKAWKYLDKKYVLKLIGSGEFDNYIKEIKSENIIYMGKLDNETTLHEINKSKYLITPSLWYETFGLTILEAMSMGTPVIGFNIGTRNEFIHNEKNGFISEINNLTATIKKAYNYKNYEFLCTNARIFSNKFSENKIIKEQIIIYQKIINENINHHSNL